jgi:cation:H+ antiporter
LSSEPTASAARFSVPSLIRLFLVIALGSVGIFLRLRHVHMPPVEALLLYGGAVLAAAFLLAWAAEALQVDISAGLAMAVLAFIAVLPEYAVDLYFAATAAKQPHYAQYAAANMTGSNRLLIGVGWSVVALCGVYYTLKQRRRGLGGGAAAGTRDLGVTLAPGYGVDLVVLMLATLWSFLMPLTGTIAVWHGLGLLVLFGFYVWRVSGGADSEPELAGVAQELASQPKRRRRVLVGTLLAFAAGVLISAAEPFAESLIATGRHLGIDQFLLVQWLAPLASESPELLVATIFALRGHGSAGIAALLSSKVNQWTLLVGTLPLDARQTEELVLTASQSLLGVAFLLNGRLEWWQAVLLLVLFLIQLPFPQANVRYGISALYLLLALALFFHYRRFLPVIWRTAFRKREATSEEPRA